MTSSARLSVLAALLAAFALPIGAIAEPFDDDPEITVGDPTSARDEVAISGNRVTINDDLLFELTAGTQCDDNERTAVYSDASSFNIIIGANGSLEIDDSACGGNGPNVYGIQIDNTDTPDTTSSGTITINGSLIVPQTKPNSAAIDIANNVGDVDITIGSAGSVFGDIRLRNNADHTFINNGMFEGELSITTASFDSGTAPRASQTITNNGTMMAHSSGDFVISTDDVAYDETEIIEGEGDEEDVVQLVREHRVTVVNNEYIDGDIYFGPSGDHVFQNNGRDSDLDDTVLTGMHGIVLFGAGDGTPPESLGGTYQNFGTHVGGEDGIAVLVEAGRDPDEILGGYDEELNRHTIRGVNITNAFGGTIWGNILVEGADSHGFTNQGTLMGRVIFDGLGENLVTLSGGNIYRDDDDESTDTLVDTGGGIDRFILSGTVVSPNEIVAPEEGEEVEDTDPVEMTLIELGDGDDFATLSSGALIGATTALDAGDGDDHVTITPNNSSSLAIEGIITGGDNNEGGDTLEVNGGTGGLVTEISGEQKYHDFENFRVTTGEVRLNLTAAVAAVEETEDTPAVEAMDATEFFVWGGDLSIGEGAILRLGLRGSGDDGDGFIRHFGAMTGTNEGTLVFDTMTEILNADLDAMFTNAVGGDLAFSVVTQTDEMGVTTIANQGMFYDSRTYSDFDKNNAQEIFDDGRTRLLLEAGSGLGLILDTATLSTDLDPNADLFDPVPFEVIKSASIVVRTFDEDDPEIFEDVVVDSIADLNGVDLIDENPFYSFEFDVDPTADGTTTIKIIATRTPAFAFTMRSLKQDVGAGSALDRIFEEARAQSCLSTPDSDDPVCVMDREIRDLARMGFGAYARGLRGMEPNRHSGLWEGMLGNHKMTLGTVSLRSATYRADAGGMSAMTQYAAAPSYSTAGNVLAAAAAQQNGITGVNAGSIWESNRFWIQGFGGLSDRETSSTDAGYQAANGGVVLGYDRRVGRTQMFGIFASYGLADVNSSNLDQEEITINSYSGGAYYAFFSRSTSAEVSFSGGGSSIEGDRMPILGGGTASYDTSGWHLALRGAADTNMKAGRFLITPNMAFQYTFMRQGEYDETGTSPALLSVSGINMHSLESTLGANIGLPLRMGRLAALPKFKLSWAHEFLDETGDVDASFINIPAAGSFSAAAIEVPTDRVTTGIGFDLASRGGTTFTMGYDFTLGDDYGAHGGAATFRFPF